MATSTLTSILALYDELSLEGEAPDAETFAARYPEHPDLGERLRDLDRVRSDLARLGGRTGAAAPPPDVPGFRILRPLAHGGMGVVYAAMQARPRRLCALKVMAAHAGLGEQRFEREADLAGRLSHPGIATVYAYGTADGRPYLATELVHGFSLRALLQVADVVAPVEPTQWLLEALRSLSEGPAPRGHALRPAPVATALAVAIEVADALAHAHDRGVVHRDVKPSNVMITFDGRAKLIDFGIAVPLDEADSRVTIDGAFVGSPAYAAPEQLRGEPENVGPWTDTYALGATLFELLTQRPPFGEAGLAERLATVDRPVEGPRRLNRDVSPALDAVVVRALAPSPADRFPDGVALATALRRTSGAWRAPLLEAGAGRLRGRRVGPRLLALAAVAAFATLWVAERWHRADSDAAVDEMSRTVATWALRRAEPALARCVTYRPVPYAPPHLAARLTVDEGRVTAVSWRAGSTPVTPTVRACLTTVVLGLELHGVGAGRTAVVDADLDVALPDGSPPG